MATYRQQFLARHRLPDDTRLSLGQVATLSKMPLPALHEVYDRGIGAWKSNPASVRLRGSFAKNPNLARYPRSARLGKEQWAMARVYSFAMRSQSDFYGPDRYIAEKYGMLPPRASKLARGRSR